MEELKKVIEKCDWNSWGDLDWAIDKYKQFVCSGLDTKDLEDIKSSIIRKIQELAFEEYEPIMSIVLSLEDENRRKRYQKDMIYIEFPGRHHILYLRNKLRRSNSESSSAWQTLCVSDEEAKSLGWEYNGQKLVVWPKDIDNETIARCFYDRINSNVSNLFLIDRANVEYLRYCAKEVGDSLSDVIEIDGDQSMALIYRTRGNIISLNDLRHPSLRTVNLHYENESEIWHCAVKEEYLRDSFSPKFYCLVENKFKGDSMSTICVPDDEPKMLQGGSKYNYMDYSKPHKPERKLAGERKMKECIQFGKNGERNYKCRMVFSPALIVDLNSDKVMSYTNKEKDPFVLDDYFVAYKLDNGFMKDSPEFKRYKHAADKLNKKMYEAFRSIESELKVIPGVPYHLTRMEKKYILDNFSGSLIVGKRNIIKNTNSTDLPMLLNPCGFDLKPYLQKMEEKGHIQAIMSPDGDVLRYEICVGIPKIAIVLFACRMNQQIASKYDKLESSEKQWYWDKWYVENNWTKKQGENQAQRVNQNDSVPRWRKSYNSEDYQVRCGYFEKLFSMKDGQIHTLKSAALKEGKSPERKCREIDEIKDLIKDVDDRMKF